jgi:hypothetical protein
LVDVIEELGDKWDNFVELVPAIIAAIIILIIGIIVAVIVGRIVKWAVMKVGLDKSLERTSTGKAMQSSGIGLARMACVVVEAFIIVLTIILAVQIMDMSGAFGDYLSDIADYLPRLFTGALIIVAGAFFADLLSSFIGKIVRPMFQESKASLADVLKNLLFIGLLAFAVLLALNVMLLSGGIIYTLILGFVVISVGIILTDALIKSVADEHAEFREVAGYAKFVLYAIFLIIGVGAIFAMYPGVTEIIANISWAFAIAMGIMLVPVAFAMTKRMTKI